MTTTKLNTVPAAVLQLFGCKLKYWTNLLLTWSWHWLHKDPQSMYSCHFIQSGELTNQRCHPLSPWELWYSSEALQILAKVFFVITLSNVAFFKQLFWTPSCTLSRLFCALYGLASWGSCGLFGGSGSCSCSCSCSSSGLLGRTGLGGSFGR